jgi:hypothetical protein
METDQTYYGRHEGHQALRDIRDSSERTNIECGLGLLSHIEGSEAITRRLARLGRLQESVV